MNCTMSLKDCKLFARSSDSEAWIEMGVAKEVKLAEEGEVEMNKILELYKERSLVEIEKRYKNLILEEYNGLEEVKKYNDLVSKFKEDMETLVNEYNRENHKVFIRTGYNYDFRYEVSRELMEEIEKKHLVNKEKELKCLYDNVEEISSQLSLSDDKDYQVEILTRYGILDKEGFVVEVG